jgi:hypothetical protein
MSPSPLYLSHFLRYIGQIFALIPEFNVAKLCRHIDYRLASVYCLYIATIPSQYEEMSWRLSCQD